MPDTKCGVDGCSNSLGSILIECKHCGKHVCSECADDPKDEITVCLDCYYTIHAPRRIN